MEIRRYNVYYDTPQVYITLTKEEYRVLVEVLGAVDRGVEFVKPETFDAGRELYTQLIDDAREHGYVPEVELDLPPGATFTTEDGEVHTVGASGATENCDCEFCNGKRDEFFTGL